MKERPQRRGPPSACMPTDTFFKAEFCGSDTLNFIYIRTADTGSVQNYTNLRILMDKKYSNLEEKSLPEAEIIPDGYIVLREENCFYRAKVTKKDDDLGLIYCLKIDEGTCSVAVSRQIFSISEDLMKIPCCTIKCKLQGMEFFDDLPHLELGYRLIKMSEIEVRPLYSVQILGIMDEIPYVSLSRFGFGLVNEIQKFVPILCEPQVPKTETPFSGEILHVNTKACLWIRRLKDDGLFSKIVETLQRYKVTSDIIKKERALIAREALFNNEYKSKNMSACSGYGSSTPTPTNSSESLTDQEFFLMPEERWKEKYLEFPTGIFVAEYLDVVYRVKMVKYLQKNLVEVEFIDFGNTIILTRQKLIPIRKVDQNLAFIPPQCLRARLHGFYRMNTCYFWRFLDSQSFTLVIKDSHGDEECGMEIDIIGKEGDEEEGEEVRHFSISEKWRTSSPDKLALSNIKPLEKSTGVILAGGKGDTTNKRRPFTRGRKQRGGLYKTEGINTDQRLKRLKFHSFWARLRKLKLKLRC